MQWQVKASQEVQANAGNTRHIEAVTERPMTANTQRHETKRLHEKRTRAQKLTQNPYLM